MVGPKAPAEGAEWPRAARATRGEAQGGTLRGAVQRILATRAEAERAFSRFAQSNGPRQT